MTSTAIVRLPADLAPTLRDRVVALLEQVGVAPEHPDPVEGGGLAHRCVGCGQRGGKLVGQRETHRHVVWMHRSCRRRLVRRRAAVGRRCR